MTSRKAWRTIADMRRFAIPVTLTILAGLSGMESRATEVAVLDSGGKPVASAMAFCIEPASDVSLPVLDGRASFANSCRRARCEASGFLPGDVEISGSAPRCILRPATVIRCELPTAAATGLEARLRKSGKDGAVVATIPVPAASPGATSTRFAMPAIAPGRYVLELARAKDGWMCRADLGPLGPGSHPVILAWREPAAVGVRVKDADGKPAAGVPVRAWARRAVEVDPGQASTAIGAWTCASTSKPPNVTDATGLVRLPVDLPGEALVVAGDWKDARGLAHTIVDRAPSEPLALTLIAPVRLRAKVEDDKERPVACEAFLADLSPELSWLTSAVPGATVKTTCDPRGVIGLGPLPSTPLNLEVRPRVGLPLRVTVDAPAAGATADLGILRVRNGESIRVVVQDDHGSPVHGATVTARGSAGILLAVTGKTGEDGGVDLSGLPENASVAFDVKARGFLPAHETQLELEASPFIVKLDRGAAISGTVRDDDGQPVEAATVGLTGEKGGGRRVEQCDERGAFVFDGVDDGAWHLTASAPGFAAGNPEKVELLDHRSRENVTLTLVAADGISGRVVDGSGAPVGGALVRLVRSRDRDELAPIAEATSGSDGAYQIRAAATPEAWLVARKTGFGPCAVRSPDTGGHAVDVVLALTEPASLIVRVPPGARTSRGLRVRDGAGIGRVAPAAGLTELTLTDLAPGRGTAGLLGGAEKSVTLLARQTAEVTLDAASAVEGRVTYEGAPSPRVYVRASAENDRGELGDGGGGFTDERGRYRLDGLAGNSYRIVAVGENGRAETKLDLADGETAHLDLTLRSVRLLVAVTDGATNKPIAGVPVATAPAGRACSSMMGTSQWGDPGELGFDVSVGSNGCLATHTNAAGVARLVLAAPGSYDLDVGDDAYEPWKQAVALVDGTTTRRVALTRKPDRSGDKPRVVANLRTDPPGLSGTIWCIAGGNTNSSSPVAGRYDCGPMIPGPGEVRFHVEGHGRGRAVFQVPDSGELVVDLDVPRGGTLVVPVSQATAAQPLLVDASGLAWSAVVGGGRLEATVEDVPQVGRAWVFRDVPPSTYTVTVDGKARSAVPVASGGTAIAY